MMVCQARLGQAQSLKITAPFSSTREDSIFLVVTIFSTQRFCLRVFLRTCVICVAGHVISTPGANRSRSVGRRCYAIYSLWPTPLFTKDDLELLTITLNS